MRTLSLLLVAALAMPVSGEVNEWRIRSMTREQMQKRYAQISLYDVESIPKPAAFKKDLYINVHLDQAPKGFAKYEDAITKEVNDFFKDAMFDVHFLHEYKPVGINTLDMYIMDDKGYTVKMGNPEDGVYGKYGLAEPDQRRFYVHVSEDEVKIAKDFDFVLVTEWANTITHEIGHNLMLVHTDESQYDAVEDRVGERWNFMSPPNYRRSSAMNQFTQIQIDEMRNFLDGGKIYQAFLQSGGREEFIDLSHEAIMLRKLQQ